MVTTKQAETILPTMRAAVAALHEVWAKCREVERALGRDLDGLEGVIQDMAAGVDNPESIDVDYVRDALNAQLDDEVAEARAPVSGAVGLETHRSTIKALWCYSRIVCKIPGSGRSGSRALARWPSVVTWRERECWP
jgi:hypothetical protein